MVRLSGAGALHQVVHPITLHHCTNDHVTWIFAIKVFACVLPSRWFYDVLMVAAWRGLVH